MRGRHAHIIEPVLCSYKAQLQHQPRTGITRSVRRASGLVLTAYPSLLFKFGVWRGVEAPPKVTSRYLGLASSIERASTDERDERSGSRHCASKAPSGFKKTEASVPSAGIDLFNDSEAMGVAPISSHSQIGVCTKFHVGVPQ